MKIALIEAPLERIHHLALDDVYSSEMSFPIHDFLNHQQNSLVIWDYRQPNSFSVDELLSNIRRYQPAVIGINDHQTTNGLVIETLIKHIFPHIMLYYVPTQMKIEELLDHANQAAFSLRHRTKPMAGRVRLRGNWSQEALEKIFPAWDALARILDAEKKYRKKYHLDSWCQYLPVQAYLKNLYLLELLEYAFSKDYPIWKKNTLRLLDMGAGQWFYAPALYQFFRHAYTEEPRTVFLTGLEIDPYRVDDEGYSYVDYARSYVDPIASHSRYLIEDMLQHQPSEPYDVIFQLLPFVLEKAHLYWGLPLKYFRPLQTLEHALKLLHPEGYLMIANEIEAEFIALQKILQTLNQVPRHAGIFLSNLRQAQGGYCTLIQKC